MVGLVVSMVGPIGSVRQVSLIGPLDPIGAIGLACSIGPISLFGPAGPLCPTGLLCLGALVWCFAMMLSCGSSSWCYSVVLFKVPSCGGPSMVLSCGALRRCFGAEPLYSTIPSPPTVLPHPLCLQTQRHRIGRWRPNHMWTRHKGGP